MGLVDYSSDEDNDYGDAEELPADASSLPPLPRAFHDLYAATVRTAPADDPSLHHGRHRAIPHLPGQWPSHIYIEWFPSPSEHARLSSLLASLRDALGVGTNDDDSASPVHSFLTSDLGSPLPLHISLSRPFVLPTAAKDRFLASLIEAIRGANVHEFNVGFSGLAWYRSPDSARAFLVLRAKVDEMGGPSHASELGQTGDDYNAPLVTLLERCNAQVTAAGQPALYATAGSGDGLAPASAFHVSVAWTLSSNIDEWADQTQQVYEGWKAQEDERGRQKAQRALCFHVDSIKVKIGNVVKDVPLAKATATAAGPPGSRYRKRSQSGSIALESNDDSDRSKKKSLFGI